MKENNWSRERHARAVKELTGAPCSHGFATAPYSGRCVGFQIDRIAFEDTVEENNRRVRQMELRMFELQEQREHHNDRVARIERVVTDAAGGDEE